LGEREGRKRKEEEGRGRKRKEEEGRGKKEGSTHLQSRTLASMSQQAEHDACW
jgi:hypothetical protein